MEIFLKKQQVSDIAEIKIFGHYFEMSFQRGCNGNLTNNGHYTLGILLLGGRERNFNGKEITGCKVIVWY